MNKYSEEVKSFIEKNVQGTTTRELVALINAEFGLNVTESMMKSYKTNHKLKSGTPTSRPTGLPTKQYPEEIQKFISENYVGVGPKGMVDLLNKTFGTSYTYGQLNSYYSNHNINSGLNGHFHKGHIPANKGEKGVGGWKPTQFKKGNVPPNWVPIGSERITKDGYIQIKIHEGKFQHNWKGKHTLIWEKENGTLPKGHVIIFGDGNNRNFDINNLILVSRRQLATLNHKRLIQKDADLTRTAINIVDIFHKISQRTNPKQKAEKAVSA